MKLVVCLFLMLISAKECDKNKVQEVNENQTETSAQMTEKRMQGDIKVNYLAVSRGFYLQVTLKGDTLMVAEDRDLKSVRTYIVSEDDKAELVSLMSTLDITAIPSLEAPSKTHQFDGAAIATFEVTQGENSYKTSAFDHGKPPKAIQALVEKMLSIKDRMKKQ